MSNLYDKLLIINGFLFCVSIGVLATIGLCSILATIGSLANAVLQLPHLELAAGASLVCLIANGFVQWIVKAARGRDAS